jgi:hypothetical protein
LYAEIHAREKALSTPASETSNQIEATPVVGKAGDQNNEMIFENSN